MEIYLFMIYEFSQINKIPPIEEETHKIETFFSKSFSLLSKNFIQIYDTISYDKKLEIHRLYWYYSNFRKQSDIFWKRKIVKSKMFRIIIWIIDWTIYSFWASFLFFSFSLFSFFILFKSIYRFLLGIQFLNI